jgi:hypothetical protein
MQSIAFDGRRTAYAILRCSPKRTIESHKRQYSISATEWLLECGRRLWASKKHWQVVAFAREILESEIASFVPPATS